MESSNKILIVDASNMAYRAYHSESGLSHKGKSVSLIFGMPNMVRTLISKFRPEKLIMVWDGHKHPQRLKLCPDYKSHRNKARRDNFDFDDFNRQRKVAQKILRCLGIPQVHNIGMEADDYIYMLVQKYAGEKDVVICSNDKDFHQLIGPGVTQYMDKPTFRDEITHTNFEELFKVKPSQFVDYLCLVGDSSDDIAGYKGIGPVKAIKFLQEQQHVQDFLESDKVIKAIDKDELEFIYERNRKMIDLEMFYMLFVDKKQDITYLYNRRAPKQRVEKLLAICAIYGLKLFTKRTFREAFILNK